MAEPGPFAAVERKTSWLKLRFVRAILVAWLEQCAENIKNVSNAEK